MTGFDEEPNDPHYECGLEIAMLRAQQSDAIKALCQRDESILRLHKEAQHLRKAYERMKVALRRSAVKNQELISAGGVDRELKSELDRMKRDYELFEEMAPPDIARAVFVKWCYDAWESAMDLGWGTRDRRTDQGKERSGAEMKCSCLICLKPMERNGNMACTSLELFGVCPACCSEAKIGRVMRKNQQFIQHEHWCQAMDGNDDECTCGLIEVLISTGLKEVSER